VILKNVMRTAIVTLALVAAPARADAPPEPSVAGQMYRLFAARLQSDVGLDEAQVAAVLPRIESLERTRVQAGRERRRLVRELRRGLAEGMTDADLQRRLDTLDRIGQETERTVRATLTEVDRDLTVPQRVRLRFLMVRFRDEMVRRVEEFGGGETGGARRHRRAKPQPEPTP